MKFIASLALVAALAAVQPAAATENWERLYRDGAFLQAAHVARAERTDASLAFAARATLAYAMVASTSEDEEAGAYRRAEQDARKALAINNANVEARLQLAIALGQQAKLAGPWSTDALTYSRAARREITHALAQAPNDPWANALLGAWSLAVAHYAGPILARVVFDTSWSEGKAQYDKALALDPQNLVLHVYYAEALKLADDADDRARIRDLLARAMRLRPENELDRVVQARALAMLAGYKVPSQLARRSARDRAALNADKLVGR